MQEPDRSTRLYRLQRAGGALLAALALLLTMLPQPADAIRPGSITSFVVSPHAGTAVIFGGGAFAYAGGVIPRGETDFYAADERPLRISDLSLVMSQSARMPAVRWQGKDYVLPMQKDLVCPLARYIDSGILIAYTIPVVADNPAFLTSQGLVLRSGIYVAGPLAGQEKMLEQIDLWAGVEPIEDEDVAKGILKSMNNLVAASAKSLAGVDALAEEGSGTYVNADFNIRYRAYLTQGKQSTYVDIAGLPLRYSWHLKADGKTPVFDDVELFSMPEAGDSQQWRNITFFQNASVLRAFRRAKPEAYAAFTRTACQRS